ncbi:MAG: hypothetical protein QGI21_02675 [Candidatus Poseidoniaceae archaeon]|nr:hypothetical protein [Candidatus Poseidoniaceae archaeon]
MAGADEMVIAGSRPQHRNPIDALHSRTSTVLLIDCLVVFLIFSSFSYVIAIIPTLICCLIWFNYKRKAEWAYWFAPLLLSAISLFFLLLLLLNLYLVFADNSGSWFMIIIMAWASFSTIRFIRIHFHPVYKLGYSGQYVQSSDANLEPGEMLATCPTCLAVLAINPLMLSIEDKCPHCESSLVMTSGEEE